MMIDEALLKEIVRRVLCELDPAHKAQEELKTVYMICTAEWDNRYVDFLTPLKESGQFQIRALIPAEWLMCGYETTLRNHLPGEDILIQTAEITPGQTGAITVFPVVPRDLVVKTALCISDTFENNWISSCIENQSKVMFLKSGLKRFSGKEPKAYVDRVLSYYRTVLEFGIEIGEMKDVFSMAKEDIVLECPIETGEKRVITASNVMEYALNGIITLRPDDIITDLAKDRARASDVMINTLLQGK